MTNTQLHLLHVASAFILAPLLMGIINRVKAIFAGRKGKPLLQLYFDLGKLFRKSEVISTSTTWIFQLAPSVYLASVIIAILLLPLTGVSSSLAFQGDFMLAAYLLGMGRFMLALAALDTASPFEGMGASRETAFAALVEPAIFLCFLCLAQTAMHAYPQTYLSLSGMFAGAPLSAWSEGRPELLLIPVILFLLLLVETCRIPVDDPNTHLELTMIHEVIILDHSGPNLGFILYASALKFWFFAALVAGVVIPAPETALPLWATICLNVTSIFVVAILVGVVESVMARIRMWRVSPLIGGAGALAGLTLTLTLMR